MSVFAHPKLRSFLEGRTFTKDFAWRHVKSRELRAERAEPSVPAENTSSATRGSRDEMWFDGPLEPHTNEPSSLGGFGGIAADGGLSRERRMRPPDFRSIQQGDNEPAPSQGQQGGLVLKPLDSLNRISGSGNGSIPGLQAMAGESKPIGLVTDTSASPTTDFFKEENGYVPSAAAGGRRPRRPRAGQL
ncbi:unnamed protein product [Durusdinium trenchii]|uniref:AGC-kinase C-terminal domain-containing protein n=1 Tax=Durusdinium trenchii TaxID=1381693 RepID=A0ABP0NSJ6_9DINO